MCAVRGILFWFQRLGPPVAPFYPFLGEGSPETKGTLILSSLLQDLERETKRRPEAISVAPTWLKPVKGPLKNWDLSRPVRSFRFNLAALSVPFMERERDVCKSLQQGPPRFSVVQSRPWILVHC